MGWKDCLGFHMSDLPEGKGRSPQIYTILFNTRNVCSCLFRLTSTADDGQIISKHCVPNSSHYKLEDIFDITFSLAHKCLEDLLNFKPYLLSKEDRLISPTTYQRRYPKDSEIYYSSSFEEVMLLVRAQREPYPLPFISLNQSKLTLIDFTCHALDESIQIDNSEFIIIGEQWKAKIKKFTLNNYKPILDYDVTLILNIINETDHRPFELQLNKNLLLPYFN